MSEIFSLFLIALALSMDTFSLSLSLGTKCFPTKKIIIFSLIVGIMHFFMPLLGYAIGSKVITIFTINASFLLGIILLYLAITMFIDLFKSEEKISDFNLFNMFLFAIGVSLDSFSTGLGLSAITKNLFLAVLIFSVVSFSFTFMGLIIGKYTNKLLGIYATIIGIIILIILGFYHIFK